MTKHVLDRPKKTDNGRMMKHFADIEREQKPRDATQELQHRARERTDTNPRVKEYAEIERRSE